MSRLTTTEVRLAASAWAAAPALRRWPRPVTWCWILAVVVTPPGALPPMPLAKRLADDRRPGPGRARRHQTAAHGRGRRSARRGRHYRAGRQVAAPVRPGPPGWGYQPPPRVPRRRPELGGVAVLVVVTVLAALAAPHARTAPRPGRRRAGGPAGHRPPCLAAPPAGGDGCPGGSGGRLRPSPAGQAVPLGRRRPRRLRLLGADLGGLASRRGGHPPDRGRPARRPPPGRVAGSSPATW